jgi:hypothetical protein
MPEMQGALVASLDEMLAPWVEDWGWLPAVEIGEGVDLPPPAEEDVSAEGEVDATFGPAESADSSGQDLMNPDAAEDRFLFVFVPAGAAQEQFIVPTATDGVTLDQLDLAALLAGRETFSFVAEWDFGVVEVQVNATEGTPPEDTEGQGFEIVLSAVGSSEVNEAWL